MRLHGGIACVAIANTHVVPANLMTLRSDDAAWPPGKFRWPYDFCRHQCNSHANSDFTRKVDNANNGEHHVGRITQEISANKPFKARKKC